MQNSKYLIRRVTLRYEDGTSAKMETDIPTNCIEDERQKFLNEHKCKNVHFRFEENLGNSIKVQ